MTRAEFDAHVAAVDKALSKSGDLSPTLALSIVKEEYHQALAELAELRAFRRAVVGALCANGSSVVAILGDRPPQTSAPRLALVKPEGA